jgi:vitamin B12 transporter
MHRRSPVHAAVAVACAACAPAALQAQTDASQPEEIVVTGSIVPIPKREIGTAVSVIDAEQMRLRGYDGLAEMLRTQPGIGVTNTGGPGKTTTLRIRGEEAYRTQLIIDGVKAVDPSAAQVGPSFDSLLATGDMARVEILRGPQGFIYGADAGGVVNVMTARGSGPLGGRVSLEGGTFGTRNLNGSLSGGSDRGDYYVSVTDFKTDGFNSQTADTVLRDKDGADNTTVHAKLGWNVGDDWRLQLVARDVDATSMYDDCFLPVTFDNVHDCVATTDQTTYKASAEYKGVKITHALGYSNVDVAHDNLANGLSSFATKAALGRFEYTGSYKPVDGQTLVYGVDLQDERVDVPDRAQRNQNGYYAEYEGEFGHNVYFSAGARYDDNDDFGSHTSGRISLAVLRDVGAGGTLKYRASYGTGFRAPSLYEIAYNFGPSTYPPAAGTALSPEQSDGYDVGVEYDGAGGTHVEATYFNQSITDEIFFDLDSFSGYLQSRGTSRSKGVELGITKPVGPRVDVLANLTFNDTADTTNAARLRRPKSYGNLGVQYGANDKLKLLANVRFARDAVDVGGVDLPDYAVCDVSVTYAFSEMYEVFGRVENAFDKDYVEAIGFNTAGRAAYAGIRIRF